MRWFDNLKLNSKLNLILSILLVCLFLLVSLLVYRDQRGKILEVALEHARGIARQIIETRNYMAGAVRDEPENNYALVPEVVATGVAKRMTTGSPYYVRQVSLRYRNPQNRPDQFEVEQLKELSRKSVAESYETATVDGKKVLRYMREMVAEDNCLQCHGTYATAPRFVQQLFPPNHPSYNYKVGEVIGAISVSIPMATLYQGIGINLQRDLLYRLGILLFVFATMVLLVRKFIITPILVASATMNRVAKTGDLSARISTKVGKDEIGELISSFNEMMEELERTTVLRQESEDRYRNLIEAAPVAIATFLENGKIIISNRLAESFFGMPRQELLGKSIFDFLESKDKLRQKIDKFMQSGSKEWQMETTRDHIRDVRGHLTEVEVTLILASKTDHSPMFTVVLSSH